MLAAVHFHHKLVVWTAKIDDEAVDHILTSELDTGQLSSP